VISGLAMWRMHAGCYSCNFVVMPQVALWVVGTRVSIESWVMRRKKIDVRRAGEAVCLNDSKWGVVQ